MTRVGRRWDWSSTKGLASASSAAAVSETQVVISAPGRSVRFTHSWKSWPTRYATDRRLKEVTLSSSVARARWR